MANRRLGRYFTYAVGEIFLVVAGILIALQINNWNEERIEQKQISEYALALADDLQKDFEMLEPVANQIDNLRDRSDRLADYITSRPLAEMSNIDLYLLTRSPSYRPFEWNRAALDQLKASGALRNMKNQELVKKISEYDALTRHLDQDYTNDENNIRQATNTMLGVVNMNYPQRYQIKLYDEDRTGEERAEFYKTELYKQLKNEDLSILTDNINKVNQAANYFIEISISISARTDIEIPRLEAIGLQIVEMINTEYGQ